MRKWLLLLLFLASPAMGAEFPADITLSWTNASTYEDLTPIDPGDLTGVRFECFRHDDATTPIVTATIPANGEGLSQSETLAGAIPLPGTYTCFGYSIVIDGTESVESNPASRKYIGKPSPPTTFTIEET